MPARARPKLSSATLPRVEPASELAALSRELDAARAELAAESARLKLFKRASLSLAAELDPQRLVELVIQSATPLIGAEYGAFLERHGSEDGGVEGWRLLSLAGVDREAFEGFGLTRATGLFAPAFRVEGVVRSDDVAADPRYARPEPAEPAASPVRSFLAVSVVTPHGHPLGALMFGHPEPGRFDDHLERLAVSYAAQAAIALENARLFDSLQQEVTERQAAEDRLRLSEGRFRSAVDALQGVLWTADPVGQMVDPQPGWAVLTGQAREDYDGYGWVRAIHPYDIQATLESWSAAAQVGPSWSYEHRLRRADGGWGVFSVRAVAVAGADGALREWVGVHTDISRQRRAEARLRESNEEIQQFAYVVSHDLRSPLLNVMGFTAELRGLRQALVSPGAVSAEDHARAVEEFDEAIGYIAAATQKMERLLNAVLKVSREGRRTLRPEPLSMNALLGQLIVGHKHQIDQGAAKIRLGELPDVVSDRLAVEQIFGNLLDNALKYLEPARPGRIEITGWVTEPMVRYRIQDNGRGIAEGDQARVFELFRRAGSQDQAGEGIGLAHVRTMVRALGGRISLRSELGRGSSFEVKLPIRPPEALGEAEAPEAAVA